MNTQEAIQILIDANTRPPQIDYVSPAEKAKEAAADKFLEELPDNEGIEAYDKVRDAIDSYYSEDGAAQYDKLF